MAEPRMSKEQSEGFARGLTSYGDPAFSLYLRRSYALSTGMSGELLSRPVVGIATSPSGFNNCHRHFPELLDAVKRGVVAAGGRRAGTRGSMPSMFSRLTRAAISISFRDRKRGAPRVLGLQ